MADEDTKTEEKNAAPAADAPAKKSAEAPAKKVAAEAPAKKAAADKANEAPAETPAEGAPAGETAAEPKKEEEKKRDIFAELLGEEPADKVKIHKAKTNKNVVNGVVHIAATFNNTMVTVTDQRGNTIGWSSAGKMGFKGSRKSTAYAAQVVSQDACRQAMSHGLKEVEVRVKGPGSGRESAVRAVQNLGLDINAINDVTSIPHNGCRPKKARRV